MIDLRTPEAFRTGHVPRARSLPLAEIRQREAEIPRTGRVVLYAGTPAEAAAAYQALREAGHRNVMVLAGGLPAWVRLGFPWRRGDEPRSPELARVPRGRRRPLSWRSGGPAGRWLRRRPGAIEEQVLVDNDAVRVALLVFPPGSASGEHVGLDPELGIVLEGELTLLTAAGREVLGPGQVRWLPALVPHDARNEALCPSGSGSSWSSADGRPHPRRRRDARWGSPPPTGGPRAKPAR